MDVLELLRVPLSLLRFQRHATCGGNRLSSLLFSPPGRSFEKLRGSANFSPLQQTLNHPFSLLLHVKIQIWEQRNIQRRRRGAFRWKFWCFFCLKFDVFCWKFETFWVKVYVLVCLWVYSRQELLDLLLSLDALLVSVKKFSVWVSTVSTRLTRHLPNLKAQTDENGWHFVVVDFLRIWIFSPEFDHNRLMSTPISMSWKHVWYTTCNLQIWVWSHFEVSLKSNLDHNWGHINSIFRNYMQ